MVGLGQIKRLGWDAGAACGRRRDSTGERAALVGVWLSYGAGTTLAQLDADGCGRGSGYGEETRVGSALRGDGGASAWVEFRGSSDG